MACQNCPWFQYPDGYSSHFYRRRPDFLLLRPLELPGFSTLTGIRLISTLLEEAGGSKVFGEFQYPDGYSSHFYPNDWPFRRSSRVTFQYPDGYSSHFYARRLSTEAPSTGVFQYPDGYSSHFYLLPIGGRAAEPTRFSTLTGIRLISTTVPIPSPVPTATPPRFSTLTGIRLISTITRPDGQKLIVLVVSVP